MYPNYKTLKNLSDHQTPLICSLMSRTKMLRVALFLISQGLILENITDRYTLYEMRSTLLYLGIRFFLEIIPQKQEAGKTLY